MTGNGAGASTGTSPTPAISVPAVDVRSASVPSISAPSISVVVPTYQRRASLERLLRALGDQTVPAADYEVVVSVDGSTDGTLDMLEAFDAPYPLIWHCQPNAGRAAACNAGIARARGDLVVLLDDDMEPTRMLLQAHLARHGAGTRRCVVGAAPVVLNGRSSSVADYIGRKFNQHVEALTRAGRPLTLRDFYSGNLSIARQVLLEVGGFDETFRVYGNEDLDLCWRLRRAGVELVFSGDAVAYQHYTKELAAVARDTLHKGQTAVLLATKHPEARRELKLGTYASNSGRRRVVIRSLLTLGRVWPGMSRILLSVLAHASRINPPGLDRAFGLTLDYLYWRGVLDAGADLNGRPRHSHDARRDAEHAVHTADGREREDLRNRSLRRADWRFLLPDPQPEITVCYDEAGLRAGGPRDGGLRDGGLRDRGLRDAAARISRRVNEQDTAPESGCDLAVAAMPDSRTLRHAFTRLRPGGSCYVEYRGPWITPAAARRRLIDAGFQEVTTWWPWPSVERCRAWIPLDDPAVASEYLRHEGRADHSLARRMGRATRRSIARLRLRAGFTGHVSAIGTRPFTPPPDVGSTEPVWRPLTPAGAPDARSWRVAVAFLSPQDPTPTRSNRASGTPAGRGSPDTLAPERGEGRVRGPVHGWMDIVRAHRTEWGLGPPNARISCVLQTGGSRCINKAVAFVYAHHARQPAVVVKIARTPEAAAGLAREAETLDALHSPGHVLPDGIPRLLFRSQQSDVLAIGETALRGTSITGRLARARHRALAIAGADWLAALARATQAPPASWRDLSGAALDEFERAFGEAIDPALPILIGRAFADVEDLPSVCEHRDFSPWNILVRDRGLQDSGRQDPGLQDRGSQHRGVQDRGLQDRGFKDGGRHRGGQDRGVQRGGLQDGGILSVLDWESSEPRGLPALDLIYFLTYLAFYRDGPLGWPGRQPDLADYRESYRRAWDPAEPAADVNHESLLRYATGVGFDVNASTLHALRLLTWVLHARSEYQRLAADCGRTPPPDMLRDALFVNLLDEEARIHGH